MKKEKRFFSPVAASLFGLFALSLTNANFAQACMGGHAAFGNAILRAGHVTVGDDVQVPFPVVDASNANKILNPPTQLVDSKKLKISVLYIETTAKYEIASVVYRVEQEGYPPTTVRVKSNVSASGVRTRSLAPPPPDVPREPLPSVDDSFGCGGSEGGSRGSTGNGVTR